MTALYAEVDLMVTPWGATRWERRTLSQPYTPGTPDARIKTSAVLAGRKLWPSARVEAVPGAAPRHGAEPPTPAGGDDLPLWRVTLHWLGVRGSLPDVITCVDVRAFSPLRARAAARALVNRLWPLSTDDRYNWGPPAYWAGDNQTPHSPACWEDEVFPAPSSPNTHKNPWSTECPAL